MKKYLAALFIFALQISVSFAFLGDIFSSITEIFSSDDENKIELYEHIESSVLAQNPETFYYFETDFRNDGNPYLWISNDKNDLGNGNFFNIYKKNGDRYELISDYAVLRPQYLAFYGKGYSKVNARLLTYLRISGQEGNLVVYNIDGNDKVSNFVYKKIEPMGEDSEVFEKLFPDENSFVKEVPAKDFVKFLDARGIKSPKKENIEFLAFDLGEKTGVVLLTTNPAENVGASGWAAFNMYRKDTLLNDIGLGFVGIDLSLDNLVPFEVRNPGWRKLDIFPEGRKIIFFKKLSFIRQIDRRKYLITLNRDGLDKISLSFYQLSRNRICVFDITNINVKESDDIAANEDQRQAYEFIKALDFDYDKDSKYFQYKLYPAKEVVCANGDISIPKDLDVNDDIFKIKEARLPENNKYTLLFREKRAQINKLARKKLTESGKIKPRNKEKDSSDTKKNSVDKK